MSAERVLACIPGKQFLQTHGRDAVRVAGKLGGGAVLVGAAAAFMTGCTPDPSTQGIVIHNSTEVTNLRTQEAQNSLRPKLQACEAKAPQKPSDPTTVTGALKNAVVAWRQADFLNGQKSVQDCSSQATIETKNYLLSLPAPGNNATQADKDHYYNVQVDEASMDDSKGYFNGQASDLAGQEAASRNQFASTLRAAAPTIVASNQGGLISSETQTRLSGALASCETLAPAAVTPADPTGRTAAETQAIWDLRQIRFDQGQVQEFGCESQGVGTVLGYANAQVPAAPQVGASEADQVAYAQAEFDALGVGNSLNAVNQRESTANSMVGVDSNTYAAFIQQSAPLVRSSADAGSLMMASHRTEAQQGLSSAEQAPVKTGSVQVVNYWPSADGLDLSSLIYTTYNHLQNQQNDLGQANHQGGIQTEAQALSQQFRADVPAPLAAGATAAQQDTRDQGQVDAEMDSAALTGTAGLASQKAAADNAAAATEDAAISSDTTTFVKESGPYQYWAQDAAYQDGLASQLQSLQGSDNRYDSQGNVTHVGTGFKRADQSLREFNCLLTWYNAPAGSYEGADCPPLPTDSNGYVTMPTIAAALNNSRTSALAALNSVSDSQNRYNQTLTSDDVSPMPNRVGATFSQNQDLINRIKAEDWTTNANINANDNATFLALMQQALASDQQGLNQATSSVQQIAVNDRATDQNMITDSNRAIRNAFVVYPATAATKAAATGGPQA